MKLINTVLFLFVSQVSYAGTADISDYLVKLEKIKLIEDPIDRDTQLIWQYSYISEELSRHVDPRTAVYLDTLKMRVEESDWDSGPGFYNRALGRYHDFKGDFAEALKYYDKAIEYYTPAGGELKELAFTYVLKGFLLSNSDLQQECWETLERGLPIARKAKGKNSLCLMLDWFGDYYYYGLDGEVDNEKALEYYLQVNDILPQINYARIIADNHAVLSGVYDRLGNKIKADYFFEIADSLTTANKLPHVRWGLYAERARVLEEEGKHKAANVIYLSAYEFMETSSNIEFKSRIEEALWKNYKNLGNDKKALHHFEKHIEMEGNMDVIKVESDYAELEKKYNISLKENEITELQQQQQKNTRNYLLGLLGLITIGSIFALRRNRQLKKSYTALEESQDQLEQAIYLGETQERSRLASELHDNVNTKLAAAKWQLEAISEKIETKDKNIIDNTIQILGGVYQDVRSISHNLVPAQLESAGLVGSIKNLIQKLNSSDQVNFELYADDIDEDHFHKIVYPLYNIIFELINNILKHAQATNATIKISEQSTQVNISIEDDGKGYDVNKTKHGFGIKSIANRVASIKGTLEIESDEASGTKTTIKIPVKKWA